RQSGESVLAVLVGHRRDPVPFPARPNLDPGYRSTRLTVGDHALIRLSRVSREVEGRAVIGAHPVPAGARMLRDGEGRGGPGAPRSRWAALRSAVRPAAPARGRTTGSGRPRRS